MTPEAIKQAREIIDAATRGPWIYKGKQKHYPLNWHQVDGPPSYYDSFAVDLILYKMEDANFIAAARTGWPEALDEVERLQKEICKAVPMIAEVSMRQMRNIADDENKKLRAVAEAAKQHLFSTAEFYRNTLAWQDLSSALQALEG